MTWVIAALGRGTEVYCFLAGMMALAKFAKIEGVFAWLAAACRRSRRSS